MKLKYYLSWVVLTMFLLSSFAVLGEENTTSTNPSTDTKTDTNREKTTSNVRDRVDVREDVRDKREDLRDKREDVRDKLNIDRERCIKKCVEESGEGAKIRCEAKCKVADLREGVRDKREDLRDKREDVRDRLKNFEAAKERLRLAEDKLKIEKIKFIEARDRFKKECASIANADNGSCRRIKSEIKSDAKPHLLNTANAVLESLNKLKAKVDASDYLEENDKKEILANIDAKITKVNDLIKKIEALNENSTFEEVKQLSQEITATWKEIRPLLEIQHRKVEILGFGRIIKNSEKLEERLKNTLEKMKAKGYDVTNLDVLVAEFESELKLAKASHIEALKLISAGDVKGAHEKLADARKNLKLAHETLKKIVQEIKNRDKKVLETTESEQTSTETTKQTAVTS